VTFFSALLASFQAWLGRETGQEDVLTLVTVSGRSHPSLQNLVGLVANVLPMRLNLLGAPDFRTVMRRSSELVSSAVAHQVLPLSHILDLFPSVSSTNDAPPLQVLFLHNSSPFPSLSLPGVTFTPGDAIDHGTARFDLIIDVSETHHGLTGHLRYRSDLFEPQTVAGLAAGWKHFVQQVLKDPDGLVLPRRSNGHDRNRLIQNKPNGADGAVRGGEASSAVEGLVDSDILDPSVALGRFGVAATGCGSIALLPPVMPRTELEKKLVKLWELVFETKPIGIHDNFFGLGGHSLLGVKLLAAIERSLGKKLRLCLLFKEPTVARLAQAIEENRAPAVSSLVEIQPHGDKSPLFLVHGAGGGMFWGYSNLARQLGPDQPVYAFKSRAMDGLPEFTRVEDMAAHYVADLRRFQPHGPYYLGGYCFGGNVAYDMARQITKDGDEVALVLLINCWPNNSSYTRLRWTPEFFAKAGWNFCLRLAHQVRSGARQPRDYFAWRAAWAWKRLKSLFTHRPENQVTVEDIVDLSPLPENERGLWRTHVQAWLGYQPQPYSGRVVLLRTRGHPLICSFDHQMGWGSFVTDGVTVKICPGDHESILEEENITATARELKAVLAAA
jgi:thioesterase domain-containing protein